ncbi:MAG: hypothetical protein U9Q80_11990 [Bacillota bacterium]|nr:hypothetical protein [Bacillota bacterium]
MKDLEYKLNECQKNKNHMYRNELINKYMPFIIKTISNTTGEYVSNENSEELIIGMQAFNEAIDRYNPEKGSLLNLASITIKSRVKDWQKSDKYYKYHRQFEDGEEAGIYEFDNSDDEELVNEVEKFKNTLKLFNINFENLISSSPKHRRTKTEISNLSYEASKNDPITKKLYKKKKLPMAEIVLKYRTTKQKLKTYRDYIIAVIIVYKEKLSIIKNYIDIGGSEDV